MSSAVLTLRATASDRIAHLGLAFVAFVLLALYAISTRGAERLRGGGGRGLQWVRRSLVQGLYDVRARCLHAFGAQCDDALLRYGARKGRGVSAVMRAGRPVAWLRSTPRSS